MIFTYRFASSRQALAELWKNIGLLALRDEAVGHHAHNIEMLPVICFGGGMARLVNYTMSNLKVSD